MKYFPIDMARPEWDRMNDFFDALEPGAVNITVASFSDDKLQRKIVCILIERGEKVTAHGFTPDEAIGIAQTCPRGSEFQRLADDMIKAAMAAKRGGSQVH
jgi:hypothetical protein